jgi:hypothetical protein
MIKPARVAPAEPGIRQAAIRGPGPQSAGRDAAIAETRRTAAPQKFQRHFNPLRSFFGRLDKIASGFEPAGWVPRPMNVRPLWPSGIVNSYREFKDAVSTSLLRGGSAPQQLSRFVIGACAPIHPASVHAARSDCLSPGGLAFCYEPRSSRDRGAIGRRSGPDSGQPQDWPAAEKRLHAPHPLRLAPSPRMKSPCSA